MRRDELSLPPPPSSDRPGDRWICGRSSDQSPCARGPSLDGTCPMAEHCCPQRSWHGTRQRIGLVAGGVTLLALVVFFFSVDNAIVFKPGELATSHAQILSGTLTSQRCAACHPQAATSLASWFSSSAAGHQQVTQTDRCLDCHHTTIDRSRAKLAHNLPSRTRAEIRLAKATSDLHSWHDRMPGPALDQENVECNVCHREHRGAEGDLLAISNAQCQTCHVDRFGSFAHSHPSWGEWPYGKGGAIAFHHRTHANKHFPATTNGGQAVEFQCRDCHTLQPNGELSRTVSYERGCQSCHDEALRVEAAEGIDLLALPSLSQESARRLRSWPESATGLFDGKIAALADLLLRSDAGAASALRRIPGHDFSRIKASDESQVAASVQIAEALRRLILDLSEGGQPSFFDRAKRLGVVPSTLVPLVRSLPPQLIQDASDTWFRQVPQANVVHLDHRLDAADQSEDARDRHWQERIDDDDLLRGPGDPHADLLSAQDDNSEDELLLDPAASFGGADPLATDPLSEPTSPSDAAPILSSPRFEADKMIPAGGWYRDDLTMEIRYRGGSHDDPVLRALVELISQLRLGDPARRNLLNTRAVQACVACHPGALDSRGDWRSEPLIGRRRELTKFTHGPHLHIAQLTDCGHCHRVSGQVATESLDAPVPTVAATGIAHGIEFVPLGREACASCHTSHAAGDDCVKCHRYHIDLP